jgi:hypothetical protein
MRIYANRANVNDGNVMLINANDVLDKLKYMWTEAESVGEISDTVEAMIDEIEAMANTEPESIDPVKGECGHLYDYNKWYACPKCKPELPQKIGRY